MEDKKDPNRSEHLVRDSQKKGATTTTDDDDSWGDSSSDSENSRKKELALAEKWKQIYGNASKTPTPEPQPDENNPSDDKGKQETDSTKLLPSPFASAVENDASQGPTIVDDEINVSNQKTASSNGARDRSSSFSSKSGNNGDRNEQQARIVDNPQKDSNSQLSAEIRDIFEIKKPDNLSILKAKGFSDGGFTGNKISDTKVEDNDSKNSWSESESEEDKKQVKVNTTGWGSNDALENDNTLVQRPASVVGKDILASIDTVLKAFQIEEENIKVKADGKVDWSSSSDDEDDKSEDFPKSSGVKSMPRHTENENYNEKELETIPEDHELEILSPSSSWSCSLDDKHDQDLNTPHMKHKKESEDVAVAVTIQPSAVATWASSSDKPQNVLNEPNVAKTSSSNVIDNLVDWDSDETLSEIGKIPTSSQPQVPSAETFEKLADDDDDILKKSVASSGNLEPLRKQTSYSTYSKDGQGDVSSTAQSTTESEEKLKKVERMFMFKEPSSPSKSTTKQSSLIKKPLSDKTKEKNLEKPQVVVPNQPKTKNHKQAKGSKDPVPYSTLLLADPTVLQKQLSSSVNELNSESSNFLVGDLPATSKSLSNVSVTTSASEGKLAKKPFFKRLKGKISKITRSKSSTTKSSKSFPSSDFDTRDRSISLDTLDSGSELHDKLVTDSAEEPEQDPLLESEHNFFKLLLKAKDILEQRLLLKETPHAVKSTSDFGLDSSVTSGAAKSSDSSSLNNMKSSPSAETIAKPTGIGSSTMRYCDMVDPCNPDIQLVNDLLGQVSCIYQKVVGSNCTFATDTQQFEGLLQQTQQRLDCCEQLRIELEREIACLRNALRAAEKALDEETQRRLNLEGMVANLRCQLDCVEQELCVTNAQKQQLEACLAELQLQMQRYCEQLQTVVVERDELIKSCNTHQVSLGDGSSKISQLSAALEKCCAQIDELVKEKGLMQAEINRLKREIEDLKAERDALLAKLKCEQEQWAKDKCLSDEIIAKLKAEVVCLQTAKEEICRKTGEALKLHHEELDCLAGKVEQFKDLYEKEKKVREDLEKRLQDCEEQKKRGLQQPAMQTQQIAQYQTQVTQMRTDCDQFQKDIQRLEQERADLNNAKQCLEQHVEATEKEKVALQNDLLSLQKQSSSFKVDKSELQSVTQQLANSVQASKQLELNFTNERMQYEEKMRLTKEENEKLRTEKARLESQFDEKMRLVKEENEKLRDEKSHLESHLKSSETEKDILEKEKHHLKMSLETAEHSNSNINSQKQQLQDQLQLMARTTTTTTTKSQKSGIDRETNTDPQQQKPEDDQLQLITRTTTTTKTNSRKDQEKQEVEQRLAYAEEKANKLQETLNLQQAAEEESLRIRRTEKEKARKYKEELEQEKAQYKKDIRQELEKQFQEAKKRLEQEFIEKTIRNTTNGIDSDADANGNSAVIPDPNPELEAAVKSLKHETKKLKKLVNERDEHIGTLQTIINQVKKKYSEQNKQLRMQSVQMDNLRDDLERQGSLAHSEQHELQRENARLLHERKKFEKEKAHLEEKVLRVEKERVTLQNLAKAKDRIEGEVLRLKEAISTQFVDRNEVTKIVAAYDEKFAGMKNQFEAQLEMNRQLAEINEYLGRQSQDRALIEKIRDSNENLLRRELNSVSASMKLDTEKLKKLIKERDEEIASLRKAVGILKTKYATEAQHREELMKKVQILSSISQETLHPTNSGNNNTC